MNTATSSKPDVYATALAALELGFSPLPPRQDGSKAPLADVRTEDGGWTWLPYQTTPATRGRLRGLMGRNR